MKKSKRFDCVRLKNEIQAQLLREQRGLTESEIQARTEQELATSDSPAARFWRGLTATHPVSKVAESPSSYRARRRPTKTKNS
jgi:hypothetical protein